MAGQDAGTNTPHHRVSLNGFARFVSAKSSGRLDCVREQISLYGNSYRASSFYGDFVGALVAGRRSGADELALQRCVVDADERRRSHYATLRRHWLAMPQLHLPLATAGRAQWESEDLTVTIAPELALLRSGSPLVVKLWLYKDPPPIDSIYAMHWLMEKHLDQLCRGSVPAVLDLRREKLHERGKRPFKRGYEQLLRSEAASMALLWSSLAESA